MTWPAGLQSLTFGEHFNQILDNTTWPAGLQSLIFAGNFNQSLNNVAWPTGLQSLTFGNYGLLSGSSPRTLRTLVFVLGGMRTRLTC